MHRHWLTFILLAGLLPTLLGAKDKKVRFHDLRQENGQVVTQLEIKDLLDADLVKGLKKGMTAALEYQVQLWESRTGWTDRLIEERFHRMKLAFDPWSKCFTVETREAQPQLLSEEALRRHCTDLEALRVGSLAHIEKDRRYFIGLRVILKPMSVESMDEVTKWLGGEVKSIDAKAVIEGKPSQKKAGNWLMGLVLNITGFGDRVITAKSPDFRLREDLLEFEDLDP